LSRFVRLVERARRRSPVSSASPATTGRFAAPFALLVLGAVAACGESPAPHVESPSAPRALQRVVPSNATAVDFAAALLDPDQFAGLPVQALDYSSLHDAPESFARAARFESYLAEPVLALDPQVVLVDVYQAPETTARLRSAGVRVITLPVIASWTDARAALLELGREFDRVDRAETVARDLDRRVGALRERSAVAPRRTAVCYSNFGGVGSTAGGATTISNVMELAGLVNLSAADGREGHFDLSFESLLTLDPEVIVVSAPLKLPPSAQGDLGGASERVLRGEPALASLRAVREDRIVALPAWLFATSSHEIVSAAERLRSELDAIEERAARAR